MHCSKTYEQSKAKHVYKAHSNEMQPLLKEFHYDICISSVTIRTIPIRTAAPIYNFGGADITVMPLSANYGIGI